MVFLGRWPGPVFPPESSTGLSGVEGGAASFAAVSGPEGAGSWHGSQLRRGRLRPQAQVLCAGLGLGRRGTPGGPAGPVSLLPPGPVHRAL